MHGQPDELAEAARVRGGLEEGTFTATSHPAADAGDAPATTLSARHGRGLRPYLPTLGGIALGLGGLAVWTALNFGSVEHTLLAIEGVPLVVEPAIFDLGSVRDGEHREATFTARNLSGRAVEIAGASANCSCVATDSLPMSIPPRESRILRVKVHVEGKPSERIDRGVTYYSEAFPNRAATVQVSAIVQD